jgi:hypothetical protein
MESLVRRPDDSLHRTISLENAVTGRRLVISADAHEGPFKED